MRPELPPLERYVELLKRIWGAKMLSNFGPLAREFESAAQDYLHNPHVRAIASADLGLMTAIAALELPEYQFIQTRAEMINVSMRWWGHRYLYDGEELERRMRDAGFATIRRCGYGESTVAELAGLETRPDSMLILEAVRP